MSLKPTLAPTTGQNCKADAAATHTNTTPSGNPISIKLMLGGPCNEEVASETPESFLAEEGESSLEENQSVAEDGDG